MTKKKNKLTNGDFDNTKRKQIFDDSINKIAYGMMIMVQDQIHIGDVKALTGAIAEQLLPNGQKVQIQLRVLFDESNFLSDLIAVETTKPLENHSTIVN